jgi:hypothetical protein
MIVAGPLKAATCVRAVRVSWVAVAEHVQRRAALVVADVDVGPRLKEAAYRVTVGESARFVQSGVAVTVTCAHQTKTG